MTPQQAYNLNPEAWQRAAAYIGCDLTFLLTVVGFETAHTFRPDITNGSGSGAVGLIQFMPTTAQLLGTTTAELRTMTVPEQLEFVIAYFSLPGNQAPYYDVGDLYMAIFMPAHRNKDENYVVIDQANKPTTYQQNKGLDTDNDGKIRKYEILQRIRNLYAQHWAYEPQPTIPTTDPYNTTNTNTNNGTWSKKKYSGRYRNHFNNRLNPKTKLNKLKNGKTKK